jgi:hypothetical protein
MKRQATITNGNESSTTKNRKRRWITTRKRRMKRKRKVLTLADQRKNPKCVLNYEDMQTIV